MLDDASFEQLCADIAAVGLQRQLVVWRGELIDGRNRMRAVIQLGRDPGEYCRALADDADPVAFALSANLHRRHLTESQRAMIGQRVKELRSGDASARMVAGKALSDPCADLHKGESNSTTSSSCEAAKAVNVSPRLIDNAQRVVTHGVPELSAAVIGGSVSLDTAAETGGGTDPVYQFVRSLQSSYVFPSHGRYIGPDSTPFNAMARKPGETIGHNWKIPLPTGKRITRHVAWDGNFWKTFVASRLKLPTGARGGLNLFGSNG